MKSILARQVMGAASRLLLVLALAVSVLPFRAAPAHAAWPYDDYGYPGYYGIDIVYGGVWSRQAVADNMGLFKPYGFDENFAWYSNDTYLTVQRYDSRVWSSRSPANSYSYYSNGRWWTGLNAIFDAGGTVRLYEWGGSFVAKVCGNHSPSGVNPAPPKVSGYKWNDLNGNGQWDSGEPGKSGWRMELWKGASKLATTYTNSNGYYEFSIDARNGRTPGWYTIREETRDGWVAKTPVARSVNVVEGPYSAGRNYGGNNFGNFQAGSVSGVKWADLNGNGAKETDEAGLPGWTIELLKNGTVVQVAETGAGGQYGFTGIDAGSYVVREVMQEGWRQTYPTNSAYTLTVTSGSEYRDIDFGNTQDGSIQPLKVHDLDMDGKWDQGTESLLDGWTMHMTGTSGMMYEPLLTTSDVLTSPLWDNLAGGVYTVWEELQDGYSPTGDATQTVSLSSGQHVTVPFFNVQTGCISGTKYHDFNGDGSKQIDEPYITGWGITLTRSDGTTQAVTTNEQGHYEFCDLVPGEYRVYEESRPFWRQTTAASSEVVLSPGQTVGIHFGNRLVGEIVGAKYHDLDGDGSHDDGEPPVGGVEVHLRASDGTSIGPPTFTDLHGRYAFMDVVPGDYVVEETVPDGWAASSPTTYSVTVTGGKTEVVEPFLNVELVTVAGLKYDDANANCIRDLENTEETGLPGWEIELHRLNGAEWSVEATTVTGLNGAYEFTGLWPGTYRLKEVLKEGWRQTQAPQLDLSVSGGDVVEGQDFGNIELSSLTLHKWDDSNSNGSWDNGEKPIPGWEFAFQGQAVNGSETTATVLTGADGSVAVEDLLPGTYTATEQTVGLSLHADGTVAEPGWRATTPESRTIELARGVDEAAYFGNIEMGWIWGRVTHELYGHGVAGVKIDIEETGEATYTNGDGYYFYYGVEPNETSACPTPDYIVGMDLNGTTWLTRDAVNKSVVVPEGGFGRADFTVYDDREAWGNAPRTIGYWKNWKNHYTAAEMQALVDKVNAGSVEFSGLTVDDVRQVLHLDKKTSMETKARAQFLAAWLNVASGNLGLNTMVDVSLIDGWDTVIDSADADGLTTVLDFMRDIETAFFQGGWTKEVWEIVKDLLDFLNNGLLR